jgi:hypothetical protein
MAARLPVYSSSPDVRFEESVPRRREVLPRITHVQILDFDGDGKQDILACDASRNGIVLFRQIAPDSWTEDLLAGDINVPAHAVVVDLDQDGQRDLVVATLGNIFPSDELVGEVLWLRNDNGNFKPEVLLTDVRRVADVQPGDMDGDGDIDLAVAVFGYARGEILWLENRGSTAVGRLQFRDHQLLSRPGTIHVPVEDCDGDGDLDIAAIVTQDEEELWGFENDGKGVFTKRLLWFSDNFDVGSAGLVSVDLDQDGDLDFLVPQGDNLEDKNAWPQPYHGCLYVENHGGWKFSSRTIAEFGLTYAAAPGDFDGDGDLDVALASFCNDLNDSRPSSMVWLENDGHQNFQTWKVASRPVRLVTLACGDLDGDARDDVVAGALGLAPFNLDHVQAVTIWRSR